MKSGMQMMLESMLGADGLKAVDEVKRVLPAVPQLIENIKTEWNEAKKRDAHMTKLLERIATQNEVLLGRVEALGFKVDPNKTEELPPTLAHHLAQPENMHFAFPIDKLDEYESRQDKERHGSNRDSNANG